jgi:hypothetical protein
MEKEAIMFGPTLELGKAYQKQLLEEARRARRQKEATVRTLALQERLAVRLGGLLVSTGRRLQERYRPAMQPAPEVCQVCY